jgi:hypothetical protein
LEKAAPERSVIRVSPRKEIPRYTTGSMKGLKQ